MFYIFGKFISSIRFRRNLILIYHFLIFYAEKDQSDENPVSFDNLTEILSLEEELHGQEVQPVITQPNDLIGNRQQPYVIDEYNTGISNHNVISQTHPPTNNSMYSLTEPKFSASHDFSNQLELPETSGL